MEQDTQVPSGIWHEGAARANSEYVRRRITVDPITRLEGHGKIEVFLNETGHVDHAYFQVPELRGFEKFAQGRPAEDMPQITSRICGICPTAHHMASTKALDDLYQVEAPPAARKIRELIYTAFVAEDHTLHFYFLGGPDFIVGPEAPPAQRNILGVIAKVGADVGKRVIDMRRQLREIVGMAGGKAIHPVFGLPGGVAKRFTPEMQRECQKVAHESVEFARFTLQTFEEIVLPNTDYVNLILSDIYTHATYYMGLVDNQNRLNFYDGQIRVVKPDGSEWKKFGTADYLENVAEHVEPWSYMKFCYLKPFGWSGFSAGPTSGIYSVGPLARLNACDGLATPLAQQAYEKYLAALGGKPVHHTLANHWARVIELIYATERLEELANDPELTDEHVRTLPTASPRQGIGVVEAPRGTLVHHYQTNGQGFLENANLVVATQQNAARIAMSVEAAAKGLISADKMDEGVMNKVEMAFRAYDPCHGCATHALPGSMPLSLRVHDAKGETIAVLRRDRTGAVIRD